ncbi:hypothetical protein JX265_003322 [Neoarthrinium moseri]|uniref:Carrier domain-containing protein n=1 Tax=Neoarthrinium moseri TaxID=1658444 RepID=A0A9P9WRZ1_9PEZI|nr:hypothetical protein JX265_003322 [Neoarthrinium moseri]
MAKQDSWKGLATSFAQVQVFLANLAAISVATIPSETSLADLGIDSLLAIELLSEIKTNFGVTILTEEFQGFQDFFQLPRVSRHCLCFQLAVSLHRSHKMKGKDITVLPQSLPLTEPTPATYLIVKGRLFRALGRITDFNCTPNTTSYDTVLEIDHAFFEAYQNFPQHMKVLLVVDSGSHVRNMPNFSNVSLLGMYYKDMYTTSPIFSQGNRR